LAVHTQRLTVALRIGVVHSLYTVPWGLRTSDPRAPQQQASDRPSPPMEIEALSFQMQYKSFVLSQSYAVTAASLFVIKL
jgi:hypothetical protein